MLNISDDKWQNLLFCTEMQIGMDYGQINSIMATALDLYYSRDFIKSQSVGLKFFMQMNMKMAIISAADNLKLLKQFKSHRDSAEYIVMMDYAKMLLYFNPTSATLILGLVMEVYQDNVIKQWADDRKNENLEVNINDNYIFHTFLPLRCKFIFQI